MGIQDGGVPLREDGRFFGGGIPRFLSVVRVVQADADELSRIIDRGMQPHPGCRRGHGLECASPDAVQHFPQHLLGRHAALKKTACTLGEERLGDGGSAYHALRAQIGSAVRRQIQHLILIKVATKAGGMAVLGKAHNFHNNSS